MFSPVDAANHLKAEVLFADSSLSFPSASIDSRTLCPGELFIPLTGNNCDGHRFLGEVFQKGAGGALIARDYYLKNPDKFSHNPVGFKNLILVENPRQALEDLAQWQRDRFQGHAVGITGSIGKTSTKEILAYLVRLFWRGTVTQGNQNNELGLPLTLLRLDQEDRFCLAELGASHTGEIAQLAQKLKPTQALLTQVSEAHIEGFGSLEAVYDAKIELLKALEEDAPAFIPDNDFRLLEKIQRLKRRWIKIGFSRQADYRITDVRQDERGVHFSLNKHHHFSFSAPAIFFVWNAAYALAAAEVMGIALDQIPGEWTGLSLPSGRFEMKMLEAGVRVIYDGYNASPASFEMSLQAFGQMACKGRKIIVFADMLELGREAEHAHQRLGEQMAAGDSDLILGYGKWAPSALKVVVEKTDKTCLHFDGVEDLNHYLDEHVQPDDTFLLKASRGMHIERVLEKLEMKLTGKPA